MTRNFPTALAVALLTFSSIVPSSDAQFHAPIVGEGDFEAAPVLDAADILRPEFFSSAYHTVRRTVPTAAGRNQYMIDSDFGVLK